ncbi:sensor histidine kinase [Shewanella marina]|uniref:sensor histidine kinase n=1 Tax=Shewanella marina TaxID=487319 RepID=UPI000471CD0F|nr:HAMP domain-containing sensor histidine kinase [Shewanella marina]
MNSLFIRLLISTCSISLLLFAALWVWFDKQQQHHSQQVQQALHRELAAHMAHLNPLLSQGITSNKALKEAFHDLMLLGPSFEIYTLDLDGNIIAFDADPKLIKQKQINTLAIREFLAKQALPILGPNPRNPQQNKIFSASRLHNPQGKVTGYLYVIIGGDQLDHVQSLLAQSKQNQFMFAGGTTGIILIIAVVILLLRYFTKPISQLNADLQQITHADNCQSALPYQHHGGQEIRLIAQNINQLLDTIKSQQQQINDEHKKQHQFLLHLSHDLKTPLTSLMGYIETWLISNKTANDHKLINAAALSAKQLHELLNQLLQLSAIENGQITPHFEQCNLANISHELLLNFENRADKLNVSLDFTTAEIQLYTDQQLLIRVLNNLIDNALRYTPNGGKITLAATRSEQNIYVSLNDTGSGFNQAKIDAFSHSQAQHLSPQELPQLGVGLSIVKQLLRILGHTLQVHSELGQGSQFIIGIALYQSHLIPIKRQ